MADQGLGQYLQDITTYLILLIIIATSGSLQFGYHLAELNAPQNVITCHETSTPNVVSRVTATLRGQPITRSTSLPDCIPMDDAAFATITAIFTLGALLGALYAGPFSSRRGRLSAMRITAILYTIGSLIETLSGNVLFMCIGRFLSGIAAGASTVIVPLYISEVAPPKERGLFGAMTQVSINVGILITQTLGYFLSYGNRWRLILATGICIGAIQALGSVFLTESPSWLAANGKVTEAGRTLQRIRGKGVNIQEEVAGWGQEGGEDGANEEARLLAPEDAAVEPSTVRVVTASTVHHGFADVLRDPDTRPAIIAVVGVMFTQQLCGINSIIMYSVSLLADLLPISSGLLTILISVVNLLTTVACSPLPDRLGRKTCLLISIIGQGSSSLALALSIVFGAKVLSAFAVLFFVGFFAVGLGPVPFILASELVGQEAVGATQSWALGANYVATFIVAQFFPIINTALNNAFGGQGWVYFVFAALAAGCSLFVLSRVPETKGKKDADEVWGRERRLE
ncbi:unnamed protein product [Clonostachys rosea]|uniref:Major facilitator superfamily (MFS) profile domain-containing protein n=1 Tax=Bionectria ochroleuca TaxID=29856 RepID=A0ABY6TRJ5_BIOOC|nr:unnamed protein product [Clonostachys rosea]